MPPPAHPAEDEGGNSDPNPSVTPIPAQAHITSDLGQAPAVTPPSARAELSSALEQITNPSNPSNTRALLRHLEQLRDSLSDRVDQLSSAVERLRTQANELEAAVSTGSSLASGFGRPSSAIEPLPRFSAPRVTRTITTTVTRAPMSTLTQAMSDLAVREPTYTTRILQSDNRGLAPTNVASQASQPNPMIVRSAAVEEEDEMEGKNEAEEEEEAAEPTGHAGSQPPSQPEEAEAEDDPGDPAPLDHPWEWTAVTPREWFVPGSDSPHTASAPIRPPPGLTTRGMMVRARQGIPLVPERSDRDAREADRLDRAIARYQRRHDESQREFHGAWESERQRAVLGGRVPNEYSAARADALRRHVDNSHRLWHLMHQRARLTGGSVEMADAPLPMDGMRTLGTSPAFLRRAGPLRPRRSRWPLPPGPPMPGSVGVGVGVGVGVPASPPHPSFDLADRAWLERMETSRQNQSDLQSQYEYYRDFVFDARQRLERRQRAAPPTSTGGAGSAAGVGEEEVAASDPEPEDEADSWPQRRVDLLERLSRLRAQARDVSERARLHRTNFEATVMAQPAVGVTRPEGFQPAPSDRPWRPLPPPTLIPGTPWPDRLSPDWPDRAQVLEFLEESRAQLHDMADELDGARLERLSTLSLGAATDNADLRHYERAPLYNDSDDDVLERVERTRERLRSLGRIQADLAAVRAGFGMDRPRRASDADTVVPLDWAGPREREGEEQPEVEATERPAAGIGSLLDLATVFPNRDDSAMSNLAPTAHATPLTPPSAAGEGVDSAASETDSLSPAAFLETPNSTNANASGTASSSLTQTLSANLSSSARSSSQAGAIATNEEDKETGDLRADTWPEAPRRRPRPYVSLLDL